MLAIVVEAVLRIGKRALTRPLAYAVAAAAFVAILFLQAPFPLVVIGALVIGATSARFFPTPIATATAADPVPEGASFVVDDLLARGGLAHTRPSRARALRVLVAGAVLWGGPIALLGVVLGADHVFFLEAVFFSKAAVVTFGGGYAVLAYVAQRAVEAYGWLCPGEMLDGLGLAETTPGPLIMVVQFVGFMGAFRQHGTLPPLAAGVVGSVITVWVTFVPCFVWIFLGAPYVEALRRSRAVHGALSVVTAAVVGVILNLSVWFFLHTVFSRVDELRVGPLHVPVPLWSSVDIATLLLASGAAVLLLRFKLGLGMTLAAALRPETSCG